MQVGLFADRDGGGKARIAHGLGVGQVVTAVFVYEVVQRLRGHATWAGLFVRAVLLQAAQVVLEVRVLLSVRAVRAFYVWAVLALHLQQVLLRQAVYALGLGAVVAFVYGWFRLLLFEGDTGLWAFGFLLSELLLSELLA